MKFDAFIYDLDLLFAVCRNTFVFCRKCLFSNRKSVTIKTSTYFSSSTWQRGCNVIVLVTVLAMCFINKVNNYRIPAVRCLFHRFCIVSHTFIVNRSTKTSHILSLCCENERVMQFFLPPLYTVTIHKDLLHKIVSYFREYLLKIQNFLLIIPFNWIYLYYKKLGCY